MMVRHPSRRRQLGRPAPAFIEAVEDDLGDIEPLREIEARDGSVRSRASTASGASGGQTATASKRSRSRPASGNRDGSRCRPASAGDRAMSRRGRSLSMSCSPHKRDVTPHRNGKYHLLAARAHRRARPRPRSGSRSRGARSRRRHGVAVGSSRTVLPQRGLSRPRRRSPARTAVPNRPSAESLRTRRPSAPPEAALRRRSQHISIAVGERDDAAAESRGDDRRIASDVSRTSAPVEPAGETRASWRSRARPCRTKRGVSRRR